MDRRLLAAVFGPGSRLALEADLPDADLLARFAAQAEGHDAAFAEVVRRHGPMVWTVCRRLLTETADAEDAFQATFLALVQSPRSVRRSGSLPGWLYGVACRAAARLKRSAVRHRQREERAAVRDRSSPVPDSAWDEAYSALQDEVARLPEALRTAFLVCDVGGVAQPEAARQLGWKLGTLSGRLSKARQRLAAALTTRGIGPAAAAAAVAATASDCSAVPWKLAELVTAFTAAAAGTVPAALVTLATEATVMGLSRLKLLAVSAIAAGGVSMSFGPALLPRADAQRPARAEAPAPAKPAPPAPPAAPAGNARYGVLPLNSPAQSAWEYEFADVPAELPAFKKLLAEKSRDGWEFAGTVAGKDRRPKNPDNLPQTSLATTDVTVAVFKRPAGGGVMSDRTRLNVPALGPIPVELDGVYDLPARAPADASPEVAALRSEVDRLKAELAKVRGPAAPAPDTAGYSIRFSRPDPETAFREAKRVLDALPGRPEARRIELQNHGGGESGILLTGATRQEFEAVSAALKKLAGVPTGKDAPPVTIRTRGPANAELVALVEAMLGDEAVPAGGPVRVRPYGASIVLFRATPELAAKVKKFVAEVDESDPPAAGVPVSPDIPDRIPSPAVPDYPAPAPLPPTEPKRP